MRQLLGQYDRFRWIGHEFIIQAAPLHRGIGHEAFFLSDVPHRGSWKRGKNIQIEKCNGGFFNETVGVHNFAFGFIGRPEQEIGVDLNAGPMKKGNSPLIIFQGHVAFQEIQYPLVPAFQAEFNGHDIDRF